MPRNRSRQSFAPKTPSRSRSTYSFPILKNSEIIGCMPNLGIHMSESDLTSPEPEFVTNVYETFVDLLAGITKEELNQPQFIGLGELDHPELHEDSIPRLALYRATYVFFFFFFHFLVSVRNSFPSSTDLPRTNN